MTEPRPPEARSPGAASAGPPPPDLQLEQLWGDIERRVAGERGVRAWLRSRPTLLRVALVCGALAITAAAHVLWARRSDGLLLSGRLLLAAGSVAVAIVLCARVALTPLTRPVPRASALASAALLLLPVLAAFLPELRFGAGAHDPAASWTASAGCFAYGGLVVLGMGAALWGVDRGGAGSGVRLIPAVVCAGLAAHLVLQIHCANDNSTHLLLGHASVGVVWLALSLARRSSGLLKTRSRQ